MNKRKFLNEIAVLWTTYLPSRTFGQAIQSFIWYIEKENKKLNYLNDDEFMHLFRKYCEEHSEIV